MKDVYAGYRKETAVGNYKVNFDGKGLSSSVFFYLIITSGFVATKKNVTGKVSPVNAMQKQIVKKTNRNFHLLPNSFEGAC